MYTENRNFVVSMASVECGGGVTAKLTKRIDQKIIDTIHSMKQHGVGLHGRNKMFGRLMLPDRLLPSDS